MSRHRPCQPTCPCGRPLAYEACCGRYIEGAEVAADAETLMRSRYTAYTLANAPYLLATWHPDTRPEALDLNGEPIHGRPRLPSNQLVLDRQVKIAAIHSDFW